VGLVGSLIVDVQAKVVQANRDRVRHVR